MVGECQVSCPLPAPPQDVEKSADQIFLWSSRRAPGTLARRPEVRESSGWPALDLEAVEAVIKGAPYGPLPRAYPEESLNIFVFFQYQLGGRVIY